jgi:hypothetical protein
MQSGTTSEQRQQTPPKPSWQIRPYEVGDERDLCALFGRVFGRSITETHWRWKLKTLPSPIENVWLAVSEERPIFQYSAMPVRYKLPGGEQTVMISVDIMGDPDFRRRGLLTGMARFTYGRWSEEGVPFTFGLPNEQWGSRTAALGWKELFPLRWFVRPLRPEVMLARRAGLPALARLSVMGAVGNRLWGATLKREAPVRIRKVEQAGAEFDELWRACAADASFSAVRDSKWVNWRYLAAPSHAYRVWLAEQGGRAVGYVAGRLEEGGDRKVAFIADILTSRDNEGARQALIRHAGTYFYERGAEAVATLAIPDTWLAEAFRRAGFLLSWGAFSVQFVPFASSPPFEQMRDPRQWRLTGGDFDVV